MSSSLPNILLIVADCARADKWHDDGRNTVTPNMDRLAAEGVALPYTIAEKSCTTPAFASILTGLYAARHGVHYVFGYRLPAQVPMLTTTLRTAGYHTYAEATGPLLEEVGLTRGFEHYEYRAPYDYLDNVWGEQFVRRLRAGHYQAPWFIMLHLWELHLTRRVLPAYRKPEFGHNEYEQAVSCLDAQLGRVFDAVDENTITVFTGDHGEKTPDEHYLGGTAVDYARRRLHLDKAQGLAMYKVGFVTGPSVLHELYHQVAPEIKDLSLDEVWPKPRFGALDRLMDRLRTMWLLPLLYAHDFLALRAPLRLTRMMRRRGLLDPERARRKVSRFMKSVGHDRVVQMHMRMWINTYKINMEDGHGVHVYDFLNRVPLVIHWPAGLSGGRRLGDMVRQVDVVPTIMDLAGVRPPGNGAIDGQSLKGLLDGNGWQPRDAFLSLTGFTRDLEMFGVRTTTHKYTYGPRNPELPDELYDLVADPDEVHNLAEADPVRCAELRGLTEHLAPRELEIRPEMVVPSVDEQVEMEQRMRDLGYIE